MKRGWKEGRVENSARSFHSRTNLHSRCIHIEGISLFDGRGSISRISAEQNNRMNGNRGWWSCPEHGVSDGQWNIRSTWINVLKMETLRERRGEREKNRWTAISFFSLVLFEIELVDADASRLATCREFWCIYRVNIEIFPSRRRRYRAETLIFQRSIEQRREKASIAHPPLAANLSRTRNFSFSFLDRMLHIRPTSYHAFICIYLLFR